MYVSNIVDSLSALQGLHVEPDQECFSSLFHCEQSNDKTQISIAVHSNLFKSENTHANTPECLTYIILQKKNNKFLLSRQMTESTGQGFTVPDIHSTSGGSLQK